MSDPAPNYGEGPDLLELRAKLAAAKSGRRGPVEQVRAGLRRRRDAAEVHDAYRELFMPDGALRPAAAVVLDDLAEQAGLGAASLDLDHGEMCVTEGKRRLLLFLLARLRAPLNLTNQVEKMR